MNKTANVAVIGLGGRGLGWIVGELVKLDYAHISAVCDNYSDRVEAAQKAAEQYQQNVERLCQEKISAAESQAQEILARAKKAANQQ